MCVICSEAGVGGRGTYEVAEKTPGEARLRWIVRCWAFGSFISVCENGPEDSAASFSSQHGEPYPMHPSLAI